MLTKGKVTVWGYSGNLSRIKSKNSQNVGKHAGWGLHTSASAPNRAHESVQGEAGRFSVTGCFVTTQQMGYKVHLRNVSTFFQEETFSATLSTPHLPHSYLLLPCSPGSLRGDCCLASFVFGSVCPYLKRALQQGSNCHAEIQKVKTVCFSAR